MKIVIVNGYPGCGKTTFENYCLDELGYYGDIYSTIDIVKDIYYLLGWNGEKTPEARDFLAKLKQFLEDNGHLVYKYMQSVIETTAKLNKEHDIDPDECIMFVDCREAEMIDMFKRDYETITVFIDKNECENTYTNAADQNVRNYNYDYYLSNNGSLEDLKLLAKEFIINI